MPTPEAGPYTSCNTCAAKWLYNRSASCFASTVVWRSRSTGGWLPCGGNTDCPARGPNRHWGGRKPTKYSGTKILESCRFLSGLTDSSPRLHRRARGRPGTSTRLPPHAEPRNEMPTELLDLDSAGPALAGAGIGLQGEHVTLGGLPEAAVANDNASDRTDASALLEDNFHDPTPYAAPMPPASALGLCSPPLLSLADRRKRSSPTPRA